MSRNRVEPEKKTFKEAGVGCESCHGPGSNHAKAALGYEIFTIINPAKLPTRAAADICGSCHSSGADKGGKYTYPLNYRVSPGSNLRLFFKIASPQNNPDRFWPSKDSKGHHQQFIDWERSEHAKAGIACYTCHSVHEKETLFQTKRLETSSARPVTSLWSFRPSRLIQFTHSEAALPATCP